MFLPGWTYEGRDPGLKLFTLANAKLPYVGDCDIFEIGASDTDFIERVTAATKGRSVVTGIDWRRQPNRPYVRQGDVMTDTLPPAEVFIAISAIEHIGLGHYAKDPIDPYGDIKVVQRVRDAAFPGGFFYFDVPYAPEGYRVDGTACRVYDDQALLERFGPHEVLGYVESSVNGWIEKPVRNAGKHSVRPYYYVALLITARKDGN